MWNKKFVYILNYLKVFKAMYKNTQATTEAPTATK